MISKRTRYSLAQYLDLHEISFVSVMLNKNGIRASIGYGQQLADVSDCLRSASDEEILLVVDEIARTSGDLRSRISPKYRHDERISDLSRCLNLDGYIVEGKKVVQIDPSICDSPPLEDDLMEALRKSGLSGSEIISSKINDSSEAFRASPPKYNACLNDVRVSLESLARSIARAFESENSPAYDASKWGSILSFLTQVEFITREEEKGLAGVYGFISPGSHRPIGISEEEMARLGRSLALGMCWFLVKSYQRAV